MTDYRKDFPLLSEIGENTVDGREWIYIDNAATSQRPQCVIDAERDFYLKHNANPLRGNYPLSVEATELYENARKACVILSEPNPRVRSSLPEIPQRA